MSAGNLFDSLCALREGQFLTIDAKPHMNAQWKKTLRSNFCHYQDKLAKDASSLGLSYTRKGIRFYFAAGKVQIRAVNIESKSKVEFKIVGVKK